MMLLICDDCIRNECDAGSAMPSLFSSHFSTDPKTLSSGSASSPPARCRPRIQYVAVVSAALDAICCVSSLSRDRLLTPGKGQSGYSVCMVNFRKVVIRQKVGSHRNSHPVIYPRGYMVAYYHHVNDDCRGKSSE